MKSQNRVRRGTRDLLALQANGATSRVLNLSLVATRNGRDPEHRLQPFFLNRTLNTCILLKHRVRADERYVFEGAAPTTATKLILPFANSDLTLGARSVFVGQRGWRDLLRDLCDDTADIHRDLRMLAVIERLPSLDPFLLREQLKRHGFEVARCYFAISPGDAERMQAFVRGEISKLIELAFGSSAGAGTARLVEILLSTDVDERLEPLRATLGLEGEAYKEGVFSWKGFLYYKWVIADLWSRLDGVVAEMRAMRVLGGRNANDDRRYIEEAQQRLQGAIAQHRREAVETLQVYDRAFQDLTVKGRPVAFREFLVQAPGMFMTLGERIGAISHIASFWRYRFPSPTGEPVFADEFAEILQDFEASLGVGPATAAPPAKP